LHLKDIIASPMAQHKISNVWEAGPVAPRTVYNVQALFYIGYSIICVLGSLNTFPLGGFLYSRVIILLWSTSLLFQEMHQAVRCFSRAGFVTYIKNHWNMIEITTYLIQMTAMSMHIRAHLLYESGLDSPAEMDDLLDFVAYADALQAVATCLLLLRGFRLLELHYVLGPLIIGLESMIGDMGLFMVIIGGVFISFTVPVSLLIVSPASATLGGSEDVAQTTDVSIAVIHRMFWGLFGMGRAFDLGVPSTDYDDVELTLVHLSSHLTPAWRLSAYTVAFGLFMVVSVILLLNLLIALMNDSYRRISEAADVEWKFVRTQNVFEFSDQIDHRLGRLQQRVGESLHETRAEIARRNGSRRRVSSVHTPSPDKDSQRSDSSPTETAGMERMAVKLERPKHLIWAMWLLPSPLILIMLPLSLFFAVQTLFLALKQMTKKETSVLDRKSSMYIDPRLLGTAAAAQDDGAGDSGSKFRRLSVAFASVMSDSEDRTPLSSPREGSGMEMQLLGLVAEGKPTQRERPQIALRLYKNARIKGQGVGPGATDLLLNSSGAAEAQRSTAVAPVAAPTINARQQPPSDIQDVSESLNELFEKVMAVQDHLVALQQHVGARSGSSNFLQVAGMGASKLRRGSTASLAGNGVYRRKSLFDQQHEEEPSRRDGRALWALVREKMLKSHQNPAETEFELQPIGFGGSFSETIC